MITMRSLLVSLCLASTSAFAPCSRAHQSTKLNAMQVQDPLKQVDWPGNAGFDPLHLAQNVEQLAYYRQAEIKHARLAMLGAAGLPLSDLFDRQFDALLGAPILEESQLLDRVAPVFWGTCVGSMAALDMYVLSKPRGNEPPGLELHFDPLQLYPKTKKEQQLVQNGEIQLGRIAMIAMAVYLVEEYMVMIGEEPVLRAFWSSILNRSL